MKRDENRLTRLFSDYDKLMEEEEFALKNRNFDYADTLIPDKGNILDEIARTAKTLGIKRGQSPGWDARLDRLVERQQSNLDFLNQLMTENQKEIKAGNLERNRFRKIRRAYAFSGQEPVHAQANFQA